MACFFDLSEGFDAYVSVISETFTTRIIFFCHELLLYFLFPSQKLVRKYLPKGFQKYPTIQIIIYEIEIYHIVLEIVKWILVHRAFSVAFLVPFPWVCNYCVGARTRQVKSTSFHLYISICSYLCFSRLDGIQLAHCIACLISLRSIDHAVHAFYPVTLEFRI